MNRHNIHAPIVILKYIYLARPGQAALPRLQRPVALIFSGATISRPENCGYYARMADKPFVLIVEDHPLFKQALTGLLSLGFPDTQIASASDAGEAFAFLDKRPEALATSVMLLDPGLPDISLPALLNQLKDRFSAVQTLVVSGSDDPLLVALCLGAGVKAFISKLVAPDRIVDLVGRALRGDIEGAVWLTLDGPRSVDDLQKVKLTARQLEVLYLVCQGMSNKEIAEQLQVNEITVKVHLGAIFKELSVSSRTQAILAAQRLGLKAASI